jgi:hypothetical protein
VTGRLRDLEKRLEKEPTNLGLRVTVAGMLREAGRSVEAVELYRSVAMAYRDQGRLQQALAVCRSILEIAPDDSACLGLMSQLAPPQPRGSDRIEPLLPEIELEAGTPPPAERLSPEPRRSSRMSNTPLPAPLPYHIAEPSAGIARMTPTELDPEEHDEGDQTQPGERLAPEPGLGNAARRIAGMIAGVDALDLASELDTRKRPRVESAQLDKLAQQPPPTVPVELVELDDIDDIETPPRRSDDELTQPRDKLPGNDDETK